MPPTCSGTDTASSQGGIRTAPNWEPSCVGAHGCLPHAQVHTQPVVREGLQQLLTGNLLVLELTDASLCLGTETSSGQGRIRTARNVGTFWFWSSGMPQVQTQPVVREGLEQLLTGSSCTWSSWMPPTVSEVQIHTADRDGILTINVPLFKGTVSRDFRLLVFFMNQFPPSI